MQSQVDPRLVLVVEDEQYVREMIGTMLSAWGFNVATAINGRHALDLLRELRPALVVTDLAMPSMAGAEFIRELRRVQPGAKVIVMSVSIDRTAWGFRAPEPVAGADVTLGKPFYPAELKAAIDRLLAPATQAC